MRKRTLLGLRSIILLTVLFAAVFIIPFLSVRPESRPAADVLRIEGPVRQFRSRLDDFVLVYRDHSGEDTIETVSTSEAAHRFRPPPRNRLNMGIVTHPVWVKTVLENPNSETAQLVISVDDPTLDIVEFYHPAENGGFDRTIVREGEATYAGEFRFRKPLFSVTIPPESTESFYFRIQSPSDDTLLAFTAAHHSRFCRFESYVTILSGILFGAVLFVLVHFPRLSDRSSVSGRSDLWFALAVVCFTLLYMIRVGYLQRLLPSRPLWFYNMANITSLAVAEFFSVQLFLSYTSLRFRSQRTHRVLRIYQGAILATIPTLFMGPAVKYAATAVILTPVAVTTAYWALKLWTRGLPEGRIFTTGWLGYVVFASMDLLCIVGLLPWSRSIFGLLPTAILWSLVFFPEAFIHRFRSYRDQSAVDGLTGLANRRRFDERLRSDWDLCSRTGNPMSLIMIDVDRFKAFNDAFGHAAGDDCLQAVAGIIDRNVNRAYDGTFRYGGEEFAVLLPGTSETGAAAIAANIMDAVRRDGPVRRDEFGPKVTVSLGMHCADPTNETPDHLVGRADKALYEAKNAGRNRLVRWSESADSESADQTDRQEEQSLDDQVERRQPGADPKL